MNDARANQPGDAAGRGPFRLGEWLVDPDLNLIRSADIETVVEPRLMRLLTYLAACDGRPALKEDILDSVWGGVSATEESLSQAVFKLRRLLGDDPERPKYIETIRKKGYRLLVTAEPVEKHRRYHAGWLLAAGLVAAVVIVAIALGSRSGPGVDVVNMLDAQPITSRPGRERDPALSADGRYVVYTAAAGDGSQQVFLHGMRRGTRDRQLTRFGDNRAAAFFPDGDSIALLRWTNDDCSVIRMTLVDGAERVIGDCTGNEYGDTAVSRDGSLVAFNAREAADDVQAIYLLDVASGERRRVTAPPMGIWGDFDPVFGTDGRSLVFVRSVSEGMQDLYIVDLASGREDRLTDEGRNVFGVSVLGDRIIYGGNRTGRYGIWSIDRSGDDLAQLPIASTGIVNPFVSADGSRLAFEVIERTVTLRAHDLVEGAGAREILSFNADILHPDVSPGNGRIAFSSNRSGYYEVWHSDAEGGDAARLTDFRSGFTAHPKYSPDGRWIAFDGRPGGLSRIYVMKQDGSELRPLTDEGGNAYAPTWSPDGGSIHYAAETDGSLQLWRLDLESGSRRQVSRQGGRYGIEGSDGFLYHVRPARDGIWRVDLEGQRSPELVLPGFDAADWGNWTLHGDEILYYDRPSATLRAQEIGTNRQRLLSPVQGALPTADPSVGFDHAGERAYLGIRARLESDLEFVELPAGR